MTVRRLRAGDRAAWDPLWEGYLRFYRASLPPETTDRTFERLVSDDPALVGLLAVDDGGGATGFAHLVFHPSTWATTAYCYLEDLYVDPARRGGGVAGELFDAVFAAARDAGAEKVYWHTQQFNAPARSLYDTVGSLTSFVVYERRL